jgi:hypothetical protein
MTSTGSTRGSKTRAFPVRASPIDRPWGETLHIADPDGNVVELTRAKQPE